MQPRATGSTDSSGKPNVSSASTPRPPAAAVVPTGRVLTRAVLESQEEIVRAIGGINDRLNQLISVLTHIGESINAFVNK